MEILLAALGIVGGAGVLALLQSKSPLPSEADFNNAKEKLKGTPDDPDANTVAGKYLAFVVGDYDQGMVFLAKGSDKTLKTLAEHERAPLYTDTAVKKVGMGDEWVAAAKIYPALFRVFYDRAAQWYVLAWPDLKNEPLWGDKMKERGRKMAASRPQGAARKGLPTGWGVDVGLAGAAPVLDGTIARSGSYSVKIPPADQKVMGSVSAVHSDLLPISGKSLEMSAYVFTDGTENAADRILIVLFNQDGAEIGTVGAYVPVDLPFWTRVSRKVDIPPNAVRAQFKAALYSKKSNMWVDDVSIKVDGREMLKNPSFEEK